MPQYSPERFTIGNLLSTANPPLRVPDWQRSYSWTRSEIEVFWQDLLKFSNRYPGNNVEGHEYFLGSVVLVDNHTWHLLLDGQQRLATSAILLSVIRDFLAPYSENAAVRTANKYLRDFDDATQQHVDKITLNRYDRDFFRREILETRGQDYAAPVATLESHNLIRRARDILFEKFAASRDQTNDPHQFNTWVLRIQKIATMNVSVVAIVSQDAENAALVFETLNDRGIGLSTPDLLRNLILRRANEEDVEEIISLWGEVLLSESDVALKTFLRHFWISRNGDVKAQSLYREIRDTVEAEDRDSLTFSRDLRDASLAYRDVVNANLDDPELDQVLQDISDVGASAAYPVMLAAVQTIEDKTLLQRLARALLVAYVRHTAIGRLENTLLENHFFALAKTLWDAHDINPVVEALMAFAPNDEAFVAAFRTARLADRGTARYILRELELFRRHTEELEVAPPSRVHVEHIYPQKPAEGQRWPNHHAFINRIGNLTLLSRRLNTGIKNAPYAQKRPSYVDSQLLITNQLPDIELWSPDAIEQRQAALAEDALQIWQFPN